MGDVSEQTQDFAIEAWHEDGRWSLAALPDPDDLTHIIERLKKQQTNGGAVALIAIDVSRTAGRNKPRPRRAPPSPRLGATVRRDATAPHPADGRPSRRQAIDDERAGEVTPHGVGQAPDRLPGLGCGAAVR